MLTLVLPYFENPSMLALQFEGWRQWPAKLRRRLRVVLVDDGSERAPAASVARPEGLPALEIYRVTENRPWHQHGARNLGAHVAPEGWLLLTDMDHVLSAESGAMLLKAMDKGRLDPGTCYMLDRIEADTGLPTRNAAGAPKPHPNSFVMTRETYWRIGGYDEFWCRRYGTDAFFRRRAFERAGKGHLNIPLTRYWRDLVPDASTNGLPRKEGRDPNAAEQVAEAKRARGVAQDYVLTLDFPWERVL